ncbi:head-tail joining protein [Burkholderia glumae]|uniref:head-tail joining protein n=1 Tax=Burkholderia glumae TaxID=337 RepID=UPI003F59F930
MSKLVAPILDITDADAANVAEGSVVVAGGERFRVVSIHPAGTGWTVLVLR